MVKPQNAAAAKAVATPKPKPAAAAASSEPKPAAAAAAPEHKPAPAVRNPFGRAKALAKGETDRDLRGCPLTYDGVPCTGHIVAVTDGAGCSNFRRRDGEKCFYYEKTASKESDCEMCGTKKAVCARCAYLLGAAHLAVGLLRGGLLIIKALFAVAATEVGAACSIGDCDDVSRARDTIPATEGVKVCERETAALTGLRVLNRRRRRRLSWPQWQSRSREATLSRSEAPAATSRRPPAFERGRHPLHGGSSSHASPPAQSAAARRSPPLPPSPLVSHCVASPTALRRQAPSETKAESQRNAR
ncbi:hypothetical protein JKP88DRAFT_241519 [Tribonema minus]|uniref:Uncharacterized protein n=1 Tax=Tribonema minus TaxID=303371 RepID=A0A835YXG2_9STRA|nr:hypothetical protein JKP88DRAFT_241519 [Tribonema minus]